MTKKRKLPHPVHRNVGSIVQYLPNSGLMQSMSICASVRMFGISGLSGNTASPVRSRNLQTIWLSISACPDSCSLAAAASCLGIVNAFTANLEERKRQIGLLRAVGATRKQIRGTFGREALIAQASLYLWERFWYASPSGA